MLDLTSLHQLIATIRDKRLTGNRLSSRFSSLRRLVRARVLRLCLAAPIKITMRRRRFGGVVIALLLMPRILRGR
jgi:hypothetical protein